MHSTGCAVPPGQALPAAQLVHVPVAPDPAHAVEVTDLDAKPGEQVQALACVMPLPQ